MFYPPRDKDKYKVIATQAKAICFGDDGKSACPVRLECLWSAIDTDEPHGIWGGMSHRERNALIRKWEKKYKDSMTLKEFVMKGGKA
jgi:WhiB family redox-sensing transcriptional regulator